MNTNIQYREASAIASLLKDSETKAGNMLKQKIKETGYLPSRIIMQFGDPRTWKTIPKSGRGRPVGTKALKGP